MSQQRWSQQQRMSQQQRDGGTGNIILRPEGDAAESQEAAQEVSPANSAKTDHQETILRRSLSELDVTHKYYHTSFISFLANACSLRSGI